MKIKPSIYFQHDQNARNDEKVVALLRAHGWTGYGIYWAIVEKLYEGEGSVAADVEMLAFELRTDESLIQSVLSKFDLFYRKGGRIRSRSVDRRLNLRRELIEKARAAGKISASTRSQRALNDRSTDPQPHIKIVSKEVSKEHKTTAAPSAVDLLIDKIDTDVPKDYYSWRFPKGFNAKYAGAYVINVPVDECVILLKTPRLGTEIKDALKWRVALKMQECAK